MRNLLMGIIALAVLAVAGVTVAAYVQPDDLRVERSAVMEATPADIFPLTHDLTEFVKWSPWSDIDPEVVHEFSSPPSGVDAWYTWNGNDDVGAGKMTVVEAVPGERVGYTLAFERPFESQAAVAFTFAEEGAGTNVTWTIDLTDRSLTEKAAGLFVSMDDMLGADFEKGLGRLAPMAKAAADARMAAEKRAAEEAAAAEAAAAEEASEEG